MCVFNVKFQAHAYLRLKATATAVVARNAHSSSNLSHLTEGVNLIRPNDPVSVFRGSLEAGRHDSRAAMQITGVVAPIAVSRGVSAASR